MPHALLLSPDDQAVSAITGVLEEMSVTCERPLDGVSAAQKLNSQSFDLVLVDCENLPAAKLIFDVCRRGKNGNHPVPIAIVDGRAGLPTAFRLGAELILTKPVAKDQARTTVRNAVSRLRKDAQPNESVPAHPSSAAVSGETTSSETLASDTLSSETLTGEATTTAAATEERALAAAAAAGSSQMTSFADFVPSFVSASVTATAPATASEPVPAAKMHSAIAADEIAVQPANSKRKPPLRPSDDPVLAELERKELEASQPAKSKHEISQPPKVAPSQPAAVAGAAAASSHKQSGSKTRPVLVSLLMLALAGSAFYAAWMYQPGFRALVQPQVDRLLMLGGMALPPTPSSPAKPSPHTASSTPVVASPTHPTQTQSSDQASAAAATSAPAQQSATPAAATLPLPATPHTSAPALAKPDVNQPSAHVKDATVTPSTTPLPGESSAIILSSKGAEKRLAQSVPPKYPVEARSEGAEAEGATVVLKEVVDENGKVEGVRLVEGNATLAAAAMTAVKQWRYRPYVRDGKPQPFQTVVIIDFQRP
jgi:TonB family protein